jgi:predicted ATPase/transcriptional regulator with XRE-family HTH domain
MGVGELVRRWRSRAGLTQEELAARAGLSVDGVGAVERGVHARPHPHTLRSLADALGLTDEERLELQSAARPSDDGRPGAGEGRRPHGGGLPAPTTPLVGREADLGRLLSLLGRQGQRLVTVTGPGGVGKTRLVTAAAAVLADGGSAVSVVELASLTDPGLVPATTALALGAAATGDDTVRSIAEHLAGQRRLVVVDNVEHVVDAAPFVAEFLEACPGVTVLASSRTPLRLRGEAVLVLDPLGLSDLDDVDAVSSAPACRLLVERVRAVDPTFTLTADNAPVVADLCRRLGGLPLALELVAPRVRSLGLAEVARRLDQAWTWEGARDLPARQRTLDAALRWSHELHAPGEQRLLRWLAVFAGGFDVRAVEGLVDGPGVTGEDPAAPLERLVEHSLVVATPSTPAALSVRHSLLEPVRQFALRLLDESGETLDAQRAHAAYLRDLEVRAGDGLHREEQVGWLEVLDVETHNLRAAITRSLAAGLADVAVDTAWPLALHWWSAGLLDHVARWMEQAQRMPLSDVSRVRALFCLAKMRHGVGDFAEASTALDEGTTLAATRGDLSARTHGTLLRGLVAFDAGDVARATALLEEAVDLGRDLDDDVLQSMAAVWLGTVLLDAGRPAAALELFDEGTRLARARGDRLVLNEAFLNRAGWALTSGRDDDAEAWFRQSAPLSLETQDHPDLAFALDGLAVVAARRERWERCATLLGAVGALRRTVGGRHYNYYVPDPALVRWARETARESLGEEGYRLARAAGEGLSPAEAVALAGDVTDVGRDGL